MTADAARMIFAKTLSSIKVFSYSTYCFLKERFWQVGTVLLFLLFVLFEIRPFNRDADLDAAAVASAWTQSIGRLGIKAVFPPDEDVYVGDIWAVITSSENKSLLSRSVRVGHIDLRKEIISARYNKPLFSDTPKFLAEDKFRVLSQFEVENSMSPEENRIALSLSAFPGITISHTKKTSGLFGTILGSIGAGNSEEDTEEIRIPIAETYGVPVEAAISHIKEWCKENNDHKGICYGKGARDILAFSVDPAVNKVTDHHYKSEVGLQLITRVFLMREIEHKRGRNSARNAAAESEGGLSSPNQTSRNTRQDTTTSSQNEISIDSTKQPATAQTATTRKVSIATGDSSGINLTEVFQRPLVFGYRAITLKTIASPPPEKQEEKKQ